MINILHLSQTDIKTDSRILKEMKSLRQLGVDIKISGVGVDTGEELKETNEVQNFYDIGYLINHNLCRGSFDGPCQDTDDKICYVPTFYKSTDVLPEMVWPKNGGGQ